jgi:hypothetical protein
MEEDFKTRAEEWAEKELENNPNLREVSQEVKDAVEFMMFGSIGYIIDKNGDKRKLSQEELYDLRNNAETITTDLSTEEIVTRFSPKKEI